MAALVADDDDAPDRERLCRRHHFIHENLNFQAVINRD
jgi:hypothetical protein